MPPRTSPSRSSIEESTAYKWGIAAVFPERTGFLYYSLEKLDEVAGKLNGRPRPESGVPKNFPNGDALSTLEFANSQKAGRIYYYRITTTTIQHGSLNETEP
jgi:hypothetical protein